MLDDNVWLSLAGALAAIVVVVGLAYWFTRYIAAGGWLGGFTTARDGRMKVLEQLQMGKEQRLAVVQTAGRYFLLGITPQNISVLAEFTPEEAQLWQQNQADTNPPPDFKQAFLDVLQNRKQR